jgi:hypothetical protein
VTRELRCNVFVVSISSYLHGTTSVSHLYILYRLYRLLWFGVQRFDGGLLLLLLLLQKLLLVLVAATRGQKHGFATRCTTDGTDPICRYELMQDDQYDDKDHACAYQCNEHAGNGTADVIFDLSYRRICERCHGAGHSNFAIFRCT